MRSSVRPSLHKEPNQCRLELKERLEQFPLEFGTLFFTLPFPSTSVAYVRAWAIIQHISKRAHSLKAWPMEWPSVGFIFPVSEPAAFCCRPMGPCLIWWVAFHHTEHNQALPPARVSTCPRQMIAGAELHLSSGPGIFIPLQHKRQRYEICSAVLT